MTNSISPIPQAPLPAEPQSSPAPSKAAQAAPQSAAPAPGEAVTLSEAAQTVTQLLGAARDASGVNQAGIDQIRGALQGGSYNVAPEDLAQAIAAVLKETR